MSKPEITVNQVIHYQKSDVEFMRDYVDSDLIIDGEVIASFGDYYHDKGLEKAEAFMDGIGWASGAIINLIVENVADRDD